MNLPSAYLTALVLLLLFWRPDDVSEEARCVFSFAAALPLGVCLWCVFYMIGMIL